MGAGGLGCRQPARKRTGNRAETRRARSRRRSEPGREDNVREITYGICGGLTSEMIRRIHESAMGVIERVGLRVPHHGIRSLLAEHAGVRISGEIVRFEPFLVEKAIRGMSYPGWTREREWAIISGAYELNVLDSETGEIREPTTADLRDLTKLCDAYGMLGSVPVRPLDLPTVALQEVANYKVTWENSPLRSADVFDANPKSTVRVAEFVYELARAAERFFSLGLWVASPFQTVADELEVIYRFLDRRVPMWAATMPIAGATAPISMVGAYVQSVAELFAGVTLLSLISRGAPVYASLIDSIRAYPFDMKHGSFVYGSPEDLLATLLQAQLNRRYGIPLVAKSLLTTSREPDAHAAAEKAAHTVVAALAGARTFTNAGLLSVDEIYSAEQTVIDHEIVQYARRVVEGFDFDADALAVAAIEEVGPGGTFLGHPTTVAKCRTAFWMPELFEHLMLGPWREAGSLSVREKARALARKRIAAHRYALPAEVQREFDRIWRAAVAELS
ncbi:MAG: trimethylamine methyltransferase family protein [Armatimonadetes bacterium]|nr:trimethylamine methyltransferase family protein [Armatimonadota bacterium]